MKTILLLASSLFFLAPNKPSPNMPGMMCWKDSDCMFGEICYKETTYSPYGRCIKGAR